MEKLNEQLNKMRGLITVLETVEIEEGMGKWLHQKVDDIVTKPNNNIRTKINSLGSSYNKALSVYNQTEDAIERVSNTLRNAENLARDVNEQKKIISSDEKIDQATKTKYINKVNIILKGIDDINKICYSILRGTAENVDEPVQSEKPEPAQEPETISPGPNATADDPEDITNDDDVTDVDFEDVPKAKPNQIGGTPTGVATQRPRRSQYNDQLPNGQQQLGGDSTSQLPGARKTPGLQAPQGKTFNPQRNSQHLSDWLDSMNLNESTIDFLNEAKQEGKFQYLFRALIANSSVIGESLATKMGGKYSAESVNTIVSLAFETLLNKGQTVFVNDVKDIDNGFKRYRNAVTNLDPAEKKRKDDLGLVGKSDGAGTVVGNDKNFSHSNIPSQDPDLRADNLARDYIEKHPEMFDDTEENIKSVAEQIKKLMNR